MKLYREFNEVVVYLSYNESQIIYQALKYMRKNGIIDLKSEKLRELEFLFDIHNQNV